MASVDKSRPFPELDPCYGDLESPDMQQNKRHSQRWLTAPIRRYGLSYVGRTLQMVQYFNSHQNWRGTSIAINTSRCQNRTPSYFSAKCCISCSNDPSRCIIRRRGNSAERIPAFAMLLCPAHWSCETRCVVGNVCVLRKIAQNKLAMALETYIKVPR